MMGSLSRNSNIYVTSKMIDAWYEKLTLPVAPACNMMCNFCSKCSDCISNGNNPEYLSKPMTPRQAVNWAVASEKRNPRIKIIKIAGPGEPLFNNQTFEVLKRLNTEMPDAIYSINTNGLLLEEKSDLLAALNVRIIEVSMNAIFEETVKKLYSRVINKKGIICSSSIADELVGSQIKGIMRCIESGMEVKLSAVYFPGINDADITAIALKCKEWGVKTITIISGYPNGKLAGLRIPTLEELSFLQNKLSVFVQNVEIKSFTHHMN